MLDFLAANKQEDFVSEPVSRAPRHRIRNPVATIWDSFLYNNLISSSYPDTSS